jgi:electron transport complex protein RnfG
MICLVTTGLLSLTFGFTEPARTLQSEIAAKADRQQVFPAAAEFTALDSFEPGAIAGLDAAESVRDSSGKLIGYLTVSRYRGYGGDVQVMAAFAPDGKITQIKVLPNEETPGLGKKVEKRDFLEQYIGLDPAKELSVKPSDSGKYIIDAVSGATISSRAVTEAVNIALKLIKQITSEVR